MNFQAIKTICLTGSTGFVGQIILKKLQEQFTGTIHVLCRSESRLDSDISDCNVKVFIGDIRCPPAEFIPSHSHAVIHCASKLVDTDGTGFFDTNVNGTRQLIALFNKHTLAVIYHSSMSVYGTGRQVRLSESTPLDPKSPLAKSRRNAEKLLLEVADQRDVQLFILRPRFIISAKEKFLIPKMSKFSQSNIMLGDGLQAFSWIHVDDYADIILQLLVILCRKDKVIRQPLNIAYEKGVSLAVMMHAYGLAGVGNEIKRYTVPTWLISAVVTLFQKIHYFPALQALSEKLQLMGYEHTLAVDELSALLAAGALDKNVDECFYNVVDEYIKNGKIQ